MRQRPRADKTADKMCLACGGIAAVHCTNRIVGVLPRRTGKKALPSSTSTNSKSSATRMRGLRPEPSERAVATNRRGRRRPHPRDSCVLLQADPCVKKGSDAARPRFVSRVVISLIQPCRKACLRSGIVVLPLHPRERTSVPRSVLSLLIRAR